MSVTVTDLIEGAFKWRTMGGWDGATMRAGARSPSRRSVKVPPPTADDLIGPRSPTARSFFERADTKNQPELAGCALPIYNYDSVTLGKIFAMAKLCRDSPSGADAYLEYAREKWPEMRDLLVVRRSACVF